MCSPLEIVESYIWIATFAYSVIITIILICQSVYTWSCRKKENCSPSESKREVLKSLHRKSIHNKYQIDSSSSTSSTKIYRTRSSPTYPSKPLRRISEYDVVTCSSVSRDLSGASIRESLMHHYEEINNASKRPNRAAGFENILQNVASTLSNIYDEKVVDVNVEETFLKRLRQAIREKNVNLYTSLTDKNQYETVDEQRQVKDNGAKKTYQADDEDTYVKYVPVNKDEFAKNNVNFGSSDHLKYLKKSEASLKSDNDDHYLEAKRFSARSNCPETLKELCGNQTSTLTSATFEQAKRMEDRKNDPTEAEPDDGQLLLISKTDTLPIGGHNGRQNFDSVVRNNSISPRREKNSRSTALTNEEIFKWNENFDKDQIHIEPVEEHLPVSKGATAPKSSDGSWVVDHQSIHSVIRHHSMGPRCEMERKVLEKPKVHPKLRKYVSGHERESNF